MGASTVGGRYMAKKIELKRLRGMVGEANVIIDKGALENYSQDESRRELSFTPDVVVRPSSADEISQIMRYANEELVPVTVRGAGSGLAGACLPIHGGIVISTERMTKIIEIDETNLVAVVEPGVITNDLCEEVEKRGLYYAGYPMSVETSTVGGNVACNAGGGTVMKYGNTGHHVLALEVVLPTGEVIEVGGKRRKDTNGYDLLHLFVQSEGTLGIFTRITLNLLPLPGNRATLLAAFGTLKKAVEAAPRIIVESKVVPVSLELMDGLTVAHVSNFLDDRLPAQDVAGAYLIIQVEGNGEEELMSLGERIYDLCVKSGAEEVFLADNARDIARIWKFRMSVGDAFRARDPYVGLDEVVVPISKISEMYEVIEEISRRYGIECPVLGHIGDGNLHMGLIKPQTTDIDEWPTVLDQFLMEIYREAKRLGGSVSGEHGIGYTKKSFLRAVKSEEELAVMMRIKAALDPNYILNPGKIFDLDG